MEIEDRCGEVATEPHGPVGHGLFSHRSKPRPFPSFCLFSCCFCPYRQDNNCLLHFEQCNTSILSDDTLKTTLLTVNLLVITVTFIIRGFQPILIGTSLCYVGLCRRCSSFSERILYQPWCRFGFYPYQDANPPSSTIWTNRESHRSCQ